MTDRIWNCRLMQMGGSRSRYRWWWHGSELVRSQVHLWEMDIVSSQPKAVLSLLLLWIRCIGDAGEYCRWELSMRCCCCWWCWAWGWDKNRGWYLGLYGFVSNRQQLIYLVLYKVTFRACLVLLQVERAMIDPVSCECSWWLTDLVGGWFGRGSWDRREILDQRDDEDRMCNDQGK